MTASTMTEKRYLEIVEQLGWSKRGVALFFGIDEKTQRRWRENNSIARPVAMVLELIVTKKLEPEDVLRLTGMKQTEINTIVSRLYDGRERLTTIKEKIK